VPASERPSLPPATLSPKDTDRQEESLAELLLQLRDEQIERWGQGQCVPVEDYLQRYPGLAADPEAVLDLIYSEALLREALGETDLLADYLRRFPQHEDPLRRQFAVHQALMPGSWPLEAPGEPVGEAGPGSVDPLATRKTAPSMPAAIPFAGADALARSGWPSVPGYEIVGELGQGAMGVVYQARQTRLNRTVALKMILAGPHAREQHIARFHAEAEAVARLSHPNIVPIFEIGEHGGLPFFSMEYCPGGSLEKKLGGNPLPPGEAATLLRLVAGAVHAAHQANVIHRDLKPHNVLLSADGTPKVTDFGLAKRLDQVGQTQSGAVMGTPSYMAPEQATGSMSEIGPATDVYALGAVLYELLTGHPPFQGATVLQILEQVCSSEPLPPRQLQPGVPRDLETICLKCLHKDRRRRYASAAELADDLGRFGAGEPIRARPVSAWERGLKWARRRPAQALAAVALILLLASGLGGLALHAQSKGALAKAESARRSEAETRAEALRARAEALRARLQRGERGQQDAEEGLRLAAQAKAALARGEQAHTPFTEATKKLNQALPNLEDHPELRRRVVACLAEVGRFLGIQPRLPPFHKNWDEVAFHGLGLLALSPSARRAKVRYFARAALSPWGLTEERAPAEAARALLAERAYFATPQQWREVATGCYEVLLVWAEVEAQLLPGAAEEERAAGAKRALRLLALAQEVGRAGKLATPRAFHQRRAEYLAQAGKGKDAPAARAQADGLARQPLDHFLDALNDYRQGRPEQARSGCAEVLRQQPDHFWALYLQSACLLQTRHWREARSGLTTCRKRRPDFLWAGLLLATACAELGEHAAAERHFADCLRRTSAGSLERYAVLVNRGATWVRRARWREAQKDLNEARQLRPREHQAYVNLAELHRRRREWDDAIAAASAALAQQPDPSLYHARARLHWDRNDWASARRDLEQAARLGGPPLRRASVLVELAHLKHRAGQHAAALADCAAALRAVPDYPPAHRQRGTTLSALGRYDEAAAALDRCLARSPAAEVFKARGLIHFRQREWLQAIDKYTRALALAEDAAEDAETLNLRGWAYLQLAAPQPAFADFDEALGWDPQYAEALCGRGLARVLRGEVREAVADTDAAVRAGPPTQRLLLGAARTYARAAILAARGPRARRQQAAGYEDRAVDMLQAAARRVPPARQADFWRVNVQGEPALARLWRNPRMLRLARSLGQRAGVR
jgi:tetratricopeptide (TPR) repeat protein